MMSEYQASMMVLNNQITKLKSQLVEKDRAIEKAIDNIEIAEYGCDCSDEFYREIGDFLKKYGEKK